MLLGLMFYAPRTRNLPGSKASNLGKLVAPTESATSGFVMSAARHRRERAFGSTGEPAPARYFFKIAGGITLRCEVRRYHYLRTLCRLSRHLTSWWSTAPTCISIMTILQGCMAVTVPPDCPAC